MIPSNTKRMLCNFPIITNYQSSSSSYLFFNNMHILNTRFVNYIINIYGDYYFVDGSNIIKNENYLLFLENNNDGLIINKNAKNGLMKENIPLLRFPSTSQGLEDLKLYEYNGKIKFIATTMGYWFTGGTRMVIGDYNIDKFIYENISLVIPPYDSFYEKNWAFIKDTTCLNRELFIYKWYPLEIGEIVKAGFNTQLLIVCRHNIENELFKLFKGSTNFIEYNNKFIGLVHYTEESFPRKYYNVLIELDQDYKPIKYSNPFKLSERPIEFCIGMTIIDNYYHFWISQMDREPLLIIIEIDNIKLNNYI